MNRLFRIFNRCMELGVMQEDWKITCIIFLYKGKEDISDCGNFRGISLLSIPGKIYGRMLIIG